MSLDFQIFTHKTDAMNQIIRHVSNNYIYYVQGSTTPAKAKTLFLKFDDRYKVIKSTKQRWRHKQKKISNSHLVMWFSKKQKKVFWWLLVTEGTGYFFELEKYKNVKNRSARLQVFDGFELVKTPRKDGEPRWTFKFSKAHFEALKTKIKKIVSQRKIGEIKSFIQGIHRSPGYSEIRNQVFELNRVAKHAYRRAYKSDWPFSNFIAWKGRFKKATTINLFDV